MPKYNYKCNYCGRQWWEWQQMSDPAIEECSACSNKGVVKIPTTFTSATPSYSKDKKTGEITKEYIEENREVLKQMQEDAKNTELK